MPERTCAERPSLARPKTIDRAALNPLEGPRGGEWDEMQKSAGNQAVLRALSDTSGKPGSSVIADDMAASIAPGQMRRAEYLAALQQAVFATAEEGLSRVGRSAQDCPYLHHMFQFYGARDAEYLRRALSRHAPETQWAGTADEHIALLSARARQAIDTWATTGRIEWNAREFAAPGDPRVVQAELGPGRPLEESIRGKAESAMQTDLSGVRVHTGDAAASLTRRHRARALTLGSEVAFAPGEYRPGTQVGDAIIAHELAHVVQQQESRGSAPQPGESRELERDADQAATGTMIAIWGAATRAVTNGALRVKPAFRTGLRIQRCSGPDLSFSSSRFALQTSGTVTMTHNTSGPSPELMVMSPPVDSSGFVDVSGGNDAAARDWEAGYIQTVFSLHRVGEYQQPIGTHTKNLDISRNVPTRDGAPNRATPEPWYDNVDSKKPVLATKSSLYLKFFDQPGQGFPWQTPDGTLTSTSGNDSFGLWLIVRQKSTGSVTYLNWGTWEVDYTGTADFAHLTGTPGGSSGSKVTGSGSGKGLKEPVLTGAIATDPGMRNIQFI
jgi:hypothetical protein